MYILYEQGLQDMEQCTEENTDSTIPSGLSLNDVWSLFSTHWLTDKVCKY